MAAVAMGAVLAVLAGCGFGIDPGEARVCRRILPGLETGATAIDILSVRSAGSTAVGTRAASSGIELVYSVTSVDGSKRQRRVVCRFDIAHGSVVDEGHLRGVETEAGPLSPARLYMLQRFWLASPEGRLADPEPVAGAAQTREVPRVVALALQSLLAGLPQIAVLALLSGAYALIYGLAGRANLAFGDIGVLGGYGALLGVAAAGSPQGVLAPMLLAVILALWTAGSFALAAGRAVFEPLSMRSGQAALIASAALAVVLSEAVRLLQGSGSPAGPAFLNQPRAVARAGSFVVTVTPMSAVVAVVAALASGLLLYGMLQSRFGRCWRAVADDAEAAAILGIDGRSLKLQTFALAGGFAGLGGALMILSLGSVSHGTGLALGLKALMAAILGGAGSIPGAVAGGVLIGLVDLIWSALVSIEHREAAVFLALSMLLVLRPGGLFGEPELERERR